MERRRRSRKQQRKTDQEITVSRMQVGLVAGVAIIMVLTFIVLSQVGGGQPATEPNLADSASSGEASTSSASQVDRGEFAGIDLDPIPSQPTEDGSPGLGAPDAPVTIVEYSDYQCPHCQNFNLNVLPDIIKNYVVAGDVRHVHKNAAILGEESQWAAMAALCAADQGHFWEYNGLLFEKQQGRNAGTFSRDNLKQFAADLELEAETFNQCLDDNKYAQKVVAETEEARSRGVEGTPSFFINDEFVGGFVPFDQMRQVIDKELEATS